MIWIYFVDDQITRILTEFNYHSHANGNVNWISMGVRIFISCYSDNTIMLTILLKVLITLAQTIK